MILRLFGPPIEECNLPYLNFPIFRLYRIFLPSQYRIIQNTTDMAQAKKFIPKPFKKRRYYNYSELKEHNRANDIWVSFFGEVYDLTKYVQQNISKKEVEPMIQSAGTDITDWFDQKTREPKVYISPEGLRQYYCPHGRYLDLPEHPSKDKPEYSDIPWWKNQDNHIGKLTKCSRNIKIINTLSGTQDILQVPSEETINQILDRYESINFHASSYTWKRNGKTLDMDHTLQENGIVDQRATYQQLEIPEGEWYVPAVHIYFNDDLTVK